MAGYWHLEIGPVTLSGVDRGWRENGREDFEMETEERIIETDFHGDEKPGKYTEKTRSSALLGGKKLVPHGWHLVPL